jgi:hypothetical protein
MIKFKECFLEKNKYDYLGCVYFKEDPIIQNFLKELDGLVRSKYTPNSYLTVLQLMIDTNSSIYINYYLQGLKDSVLKGFELKNMKWEFGQFIIDYSLGGLCNSLGDRIEDLIDQTEELMTKNRIPQR